jgi:hypothetical protein
MKLNDHPVYCVRDPGPHAEQCDICWKTTIDALPKYAAGAGISRWYAERTTIYDSAEEAEADARARLAARGCHVCCNTGRDLGAMNPLAPCPEGCGHPGAS